MKVKIYLLVFFIATNKITAQDEGNTTSSNQNVTSTGVTSSSNISQKTESTIEDKNVTTTTSGEELNINNVTLDNSVNPSTTKESDLNTTASHDNATSHIDNAEQESTACASKENCTSFTEDVDNTTAVPFASSSVPEEKLSDTDLNTTLTENSSVPNITEEENERSNDLAKTSATESQTENRTTVKVPTTESDCKAFTDKLLNATFSEHADELDPLPLEDRKLSVNVDLLLTSVKSEVGLHDGKITGLSKVKATGDCIVQEFDDKVMLKSTLTFDKVEISYKARATFLDLGPKVVLRGKLDMLLADLFFSVPRDGGTSQIKKLIVKTEGRIKVRVDSLVPINWDIGLYQAAEIFSFIVRKNVERELKHAMEKEIKKINYP